MCEKGTGEGQERRRDRGADFHHAGEGSPVLGRVKALRPFGPPPAGAAPAAALTRPVRGAGAYAWVMGKGWALLKGMVGAGGGFLEEGGRCLLSTEYLILSSTSRDAVSRK